MISFGTSTESVTVIGPYEWWIAMKMMSPRKLKAGETYRLNVVWEVGSLSVETMSMPGDTDDYAQGNTRFLNTTSGNVEDLSKMMLSGVLTSPIGNTYSASFTAWLKPLPLRNYRVYLHGRNMPRSNIIVKINSLAFGIGEVPEVFLPYPLVELAFRRVVQGSTSFSGGLVEISSDLISMEQSRTTYDADHPPPFYRPSASLSIFTDDAGKPWGEWEIGGGVWKAYVEDLYLNRYALPVDRVEQREFNQKATYQLFFYPPASPSYGFLNFTAKFNYTIEVSYMGPELYSNYSVSPFSNTSWKVYNPLFSFTAPPYSSVVIKIGPVPRDWTIRETIATPGPGGGTPSVLIVNDEITIRGILMGSSNTYSGRVEIYVNADNYLETQAAYLKFRWMNVYSSIFLQNDIISVEARAASSVLDFPPGIISITVLRPPAIINQSLSQLDQNGVTTGNISLSLIRQYSVSTTYRSSDGLRVGASRASFKVLGVFVTTDRDRVLLSSPMLVVELNSSDSSLISSASFVLIAPNGSTRTIIFNQLNGRFIRELSFSQTDSSSIGCWSISPNIMLVNGIGRQLSSASFLVSDDIPPAIFNLTQIPKEATFMDEVNVSCMVIDMGAGVESAWVSYSSEAIKGNVTAKPIWLNKYSAMIPKQPPFTTVSYRVYAADRSENIGFSEAFTYTVGIPSWLLILVILVFAIIILTIWLHVKKRLLQTLPSPPPSPEEPASQPSYVSAEVLRRERTFLVKYLTLRKQNNGAVTTFT
ncbi:MAG: hypothetical protein ACUVQ0_05625 [Thermoproteota archaeon]